MSVIRDAGGRQTFFATPVTLDVICLLAFAVTLRDGAFKLIRRGEDDGLASAGLDQTVVDSLCHGRWTRVLALYNVLACRLFKGPHYRLRG